MARIQAISAKNTTFSSTVTTATFTSTSGNTLIVTVQADVATSTTVTDSKLNSWTRLQTNNIAGTFVLETWVANNITGGTLHTVTATDNGGGVDSQIIVEEWSGNTNPAEDQKTGTTGVADANLNSGASAATTQANEVIVGTGVAGGAATLTVGAGYSNLTQTSTAFSTLGFESQTVAATGAQTATFTASAAVSWVCQVATFKIAGAVASVARLTLMGVG